MNQYGPYDGRDLLPQLQGEAEPSRRTLFWRLQGQTAIRDGDDKLITLSHRPAQLFQPQQDLGERVDRLDIDSTRRERVVPNAWPVGIVARHSPALGFFTVLDRPKR